MGIGPSTPARNSTNGCHSSKSAVETSTASLAAASLSFPCISIRLCGVSIVAAVISSPRLRLNVAVPRVKPEAGIKPGAAEALGRSWRLNMDWRRSKFPLQVVSLVPLICAPKRENRRQGRKPRKAPRVAGRASPSMRVRTRKSALPAPSLASASPMIRPPSVERFRFDTLALCASAKYSAEKSIRPGLTGRSLGTSRRARTRPEEVHLSG